MLRDMSSVGTTESKSCFRSAASQKENNPIAVEESPMVMEGPSTKIAGRFSCVPLARGTDLPCLISAQAPVSQVVYGCACFLFLGQFLVTGNFREGLVSAICLNEDTVPFPSAKITFPR